MDNEYKRYLQEITKYPLLSGIEEKETALEYFHNKTTDSFDKLIVSNLRFVVKIANEYKRYEFPIMDLIQEGNIGLIYAVEKFDPYREVKLVSYASYWIKAKILKYIRTEWTLTNAGRADVQRDVYLHEPDVNGDCLIDSLISKIDSVDKQLQTKQQEYKLKTKIQSAIQTFNEREQYIITHRLMSDDVKTQREISETLEISQSRMQQLERRIIIKLRRLLR